MLAFIGRHLPKRTNEPSPIQCVPLLNSSFAMARMAQSPQTAPNASAAPPGQDALRMRVSLVSKLGVPSVVTALDDRFFVAAAPTQQQLEGIGSRRPLTAARPTLPPGHHVAMPVLWKRSPDACLRKLLILRISQTVSF